VSKLRQYGGKRCHSATGLSVALHIYSMADQDKSRRGFMKDITRTLLAISLVLYALIALLSMDRFRDNARSSPVDQEQRVSDVGLRVGWRR